jgi:hypothetical protein
VRFGIGDSQGSKEPATPTQACTQCALGYSLGTFQDLDSLVVWDELRIYAYSNYHTREEDYEEAYNRKIRV